MIRSLRESNIVVRLNARLHGLYWQSSQWQSVPFLATIVGIGTIRHSTWGEGVLGKAGVTGQRLPS
jgi:hypothetical protein